jgi:group II intron reverse transcriptase/maturase
MSPELLKVVERAKKDPNARMYSLARLVDPDALKRAFTRIRKDAAVGVDGITKEQYEQRVEENIQELHGRLKAGQWRHRPIRRVHIPKTPGKTRPIGISCIEDKMVQGALTEVLEAIYEQDFLSCSHGFRHGRSPHDALRAMDGMVFREGLVWILEADIQAFFDSLDRTRLKEMLQLRVADQSFMRLVGKCLHVGVLDGEEFSRPDEGTAQGSIISPILGNVYLHHVLDQWFEREVKPRLGGQARLIRYADDFVAGLESREDAEWVLAMLHQRMAEYGLKLHPEKTRLTDFRSPGQQPLGSPRPATFDFLGFTVYWRRTRGGGWAMALKTRKARLQRALQAIGAFCRRHRHDALKEQQATLKRRLTGHFNYFGVNGNLRSLKRLVHFVERQWHKWLNRRSQRRCLTWERFQHLLEVFPLPRPTIRVQIWGRTP